MSLKAILERIRAAGEIQVKAVKAESVKEVQAIQAGSRAEAERLYQECYRQALEPEASEQAAILNQARFEAVCLVGSAKEGLASDALSEMVEELKHIRSSPEYRAVLERIVLEMLPGQDGARKLSEQLLLEADPRDRVLLESILCEKNLDLRVDYCLTCWGGLCGWAQDGTIHLINTLEARLERALPVLKQGLMEWFAQETRLKEPEPIQEGNPA